MNKNRLRVKAPNSASVTSFFVDSIDGSFVSSKVGEMYRRYLQLVLTAGQQRRFAECALISRADSKRGSKALSPNQFHRARLQEGCPAARCCENCQK